MADMDNNLKITAYMKEYKAIRENIDEEIIFLKMIKDRVKILKVGGE